METASLKSFATWARTALIREVTARIAVVLAPASPERVEQPRVVAALEKAVNAAGGSDGGRSAVADRVAYTWFNRIVALRFMDANGYTGIGVVSPQTGVDVGQPEILAEAKRANIDAEVVSQKARETVTGLLNGTRRSEDPQGEAYALLLAEYCRHWNRSMPFMFERAGDFTELLVPANLLADASVLNRAVEVLTTYTCRDVEVIGWLYQFYISERKDEVFAGFRKKKKAGANDIPAATQLFTPHWIVRYLVENSLGRLWMLNRPNSRLIHQMDYFIPPVDDESEFLKISSPEELKIIDPACGSGHMLTYAFDLLYAMYEEEGYAATEIAELILSNNLYGTEIDPRAGALAAFALTMKGRGRQRSFFNKQVEPNICVLEAIQFTPDELDKLAGAGFASTDEELWNAFAEANLLGALVRISEGLIDGSNNVVEDLKQSGGDLFGGELAERASKVALQALYLSRRYHVAIANPPYMGAKNQDASLSEIAKEAFPASKADLYAMFIERCIELVRENGMVAMITMHTWMFLSSFETLRAKFLRNVWVRQLAHLGSGAFDSIGGEVVSTVAFVFSAGSSEPLPGKYLRLVDDKGEDGKREKILAATKNSDLIYARAQNIFADIPGAPIAYWLSPKLLGVLREQKTIQELSPPRQGIATADNAKFLRLWWEVSAARIGFDCRDGLDAKQSRRKWFPYNKGGEFRRWYGNQEFVINWLNDGEDVKSFVDAAGKQRSAIRNPQFQLRSSVSWSDIGSGTPAFRYYPNGFLFDVTGMSIFSESENAVAKYLGLLNSVVVTEVLKAYAPTMHFQVGDISRLPVPDDTPQELNVNIVSELVALGKEDWDDLETSWNFRKTPLIVGASLAATACDDYRKLCSDRVARMRELEEVNNRHYLKAFRLEGEFSDHVPESRISLDGNLAFRYRSSDSADLPRLGRGEEIRRLVSYMVGCAFGRYSLDAPGLILANQGDTPEDYLAKVTKSSFLPDADNVIPIVDGDWFEDDIVARFRQFLRAAFGEQQFEENLRFVNESLEVGDLRDYFVKSFYKDHVQRYKKRPIYWLFSSPKGSFNALIYMHRYTPSTVSTVLNEYLREYKAKLGSSLQHHERLAAGGGTPREQGAALKEADRLRKVLLELDEYEHDVLYPLASQQIEIDLDDGVKVNYPKFGAALRKIPGLEVAE
jgi:hypothetical protein